MLGPERRASCWLAAVGLSLSGIHLQRRNNKQKLDTLSELSAPNQQEVG